MNLQNSTARLTLFIALLLGVSFAIQFPSTQAADFQLFAFYDPGTTLKGDALLEKGYTPTQDFGYTHGLIPLLFGRVGFALLGRSPMAYLALTLLIQLLMAHSLARILIALKLPRRALVAFLLALPIAIMPAYLTLTHPLEAALLLFALADHAQNKKSSALATLAICIFVKPSMAYVYGLVLTILILLEPQKPLSQKLKSFLPAILTAALTFAALALLYGLGPVTHTMFPITGAKTYAATNFGFFTPSGRAFWLTPQLQNYLITPLGIWLLAVLSSGLIAIPLLLKKSPFHTTPKTDTRKEILLTLVALHSAFLLAFYGWTGSWTYYSYMPILALTITLAILPAKRWQSITLLVLIALAHAQTLGISLNDWRTKLHTPSHLFTYQDKLDEWNTFTALTQNKPTLLMTHGYPPQLPPHFQLPDAWFPEPGIPTPSEIARVQKQIETTHFIIQWNEYGPLDLLNSPDFSHLRPQFKTTRTGKYMTLLERIPPTTTLNEPPINTDKHRN